MHHNQKHQSHRLNWKSYWFVPFSDENNETLKRHIESLESQILLVKESKRKLSETTQATVQRLEKQNALLRSNLQQAKEESERYLAQAIEADKKLQIAMVHLSTAQDELKCAKYEDNLSKTNDNKHTAASLESFQRNSKYSAKEFIKVNASLDAMRAELHKERIERVHERENHRTSLTASEERLNYSEVVIRDLREQLRNVSDAQTSETQDFNATMHVEGMTQSGRGQFDFLHSTTGSQSKFAASGGSRVDKNQASASVEQSRFKSPFAVRALPQSIPVSSGSVDVVFTSSRKLPSSQHNQSGGGSRHSSPSINRRSTSAGPIRSLRGRGSPTPIPSDPSYGTKFQSTATFINKHSLPHHLVRTPSFMNADRLNSGRAVSPGRSSHSATDETENSLLRHPMYRSLSPSRVANHIHPDNDHNQLQGQSQDQLKLSPRRKRSSRHKLKHDSSHKLSSHQLDAHAGSPRGTSISRILPTNISMDHISLSTGTEDEQNQELGDRPRDAHSNESGSESGSEESCSSDEVDESVRTYVQSVMTEKKSHQYALDVRESYTNDDMLTSAEAIHRPMSPLSARSDRSTSPTNRKTNSPTQENRGELQHMSSSPDIARLKRNDKHSHSYSGGDRHHESVTEKHSASSGHISARPPFDPRRYQQKIVEQVEKERSRSSSPVSRNRHDDALKNMNSSPDLRQLQDGKHARSFTFNERDTSPALTSNRRSASSSHMHSETAVQFDPRKYQQSSPKAQSPPRSPPRSPVHSPVHSRSHSPTNAKDGKRFELYESELSHMDLSPSRRPLSPEKGKHSQSFSVGRTASAHDTEEWTSKPDTERHHPNLSNNRRTMSTNNVSNSSTLSFDPKQYQRPPLSIKNPSRPSSASHSTASNINRRLSPKSAVSATIFEGSREGLEDDDDVSDITHEPPRGGLKSGAATASSRPVSAAQSRSSGRPPVHHSNLRVNSEQSVLDALYDQIQLLKHTHLTPKNSVSGAVSQDRSSPKNRKSIDSQSFAENHAENVSAVRRSSTPSILSRPGSFRVERTEGQHHRKEDNALHDTDHHSVAEESADDESVKYHDLIDEYNELLALYVQEVHKTFDLKNDVRDEICDSVKTIAELEHQIEQDRHSNEFLQQELDEVRETLCSKEVQQMSYHTELEQKLSTLEQENEMQSERILQLEELESDQQHNLKVLSHQIVHAHTDTQDVGIGTSPQRSRPGSPMRAGINPSTSREALLSATLIVNLQEQLSQLTSIGVSDQERIKVEVNSFLAHTEPSTPLSFSPSVGTHSPLAGTIGSQFNSPDRRSPRGANTTSPRRSASPRREGTRLQNPVIVSVSLEAMKSVIDWIERRSAVMSIELRNQIQLNTEQREEIHNMGLVIKNHHKAMDQRDTIIQDLRSQLLHGHHGSRHLLKEPETRELSEIQALNSKLEQTYADLEEATRRHKSGANSLLRDDREDLRLTHAHLSPPHSSPSPHRNTHHNQRDVDLRSVQSDFSVGTSVLGGEQRERGLNETGYHEDLDFIAHSKVTPRNVESHSHHSTHREKVADMHFTSSRTTDRYFEESKGHHSSNSQHERYNQPDDRNQFRDDDRRLSRDLPPPHPRFSTTTVPLHDSMNTQQHLRHSHDSTHNTLNTMQQTQDLLQTQQQLQQDAKDLEVRAVTAEMKCELLAKQIKSMPSNLSVAHAEKRVLECKLNKTIIAHEMHLKELEANQLHQIQELQTFLQIE
eukprot:gene25979-32493_t